MGDKRSNSPEKKEMPIQFHHIEPHFLLKTYIGKMWFFEGSGKKPADDMKLVVPNGNIKLTVSYQNGIVAAIKGKHLHQKNTTLL